tara:strand:+ start:2309 stop:5578 length:3270 start_codon:yes stop_codon:yes gene_type:complete
MKLDDAKSLLETVFSSSYSGDKFKQLAREVFNGYDSRKEQTIYTEDKVKNFTNLGLFEDDKGKKIAVFEVELLSENSLHRARVTQRNLIANQLKIHDYDSALCSFYHANHGEWRLSFITRESSIDVSSEKLKFIEQLSPSRRQSFIAGPNEGTHTVKKQFLSRIESDNKPSFDEIASIFAIEAVNEDFYKQYKELYLRLTEELEQFMEKDPVIAADFKEKEVSASDFAKKTLGQFVFLYFLQRKGWIKDKAHPDDWFSFSKLFDTRNGKNFFNDLMEPIFYESLAKKDPNLEKYPLLKSYEFPYLGGGLFEPIRNYNWEETNIVISDTFFKNDNRTKDGEGDGLLDVFNRFNFTVHENNDLDQEIAVDPEMLGKVFENLLDIKDRKSKGAFYTPREIVQYMCQESLINYLLAEIGDEIPSEALKLFIGNHNILEAKDIEGIGLGTIAENAMALDQLLADVKVCDPAVGSGAFPIGMLGEIVSARNSLQSFLPNKQTIYDLKLHTIGQSLYGVDLDPSAVDIARLRFWLSLIIEEDTPTPLPNLEHKLMQGNSLLSSYEGVDLFNGQFLINENSRQEKLNNIDGKIKVLENEVKNGANTIEIDRIKEIKKDLISLGKQRDKIQRENTGYSTTRNLFESEDTLFRIKQVDLLQKKIAQFLLPDKDSNKKDLKSEIENIKWDLIEASVESESKVKAFEQLKNKRVQPFFLWKLEFVDVFRNNNGFDIVIGNPPYVSVKGLSKELKSDLQKVYETAKGRLNLFTLFIEFGYKILNKKTTLSYIIPENIFSNYEYRHTRNFLLNNNSLSKVCRFEKRVFDAAVDTAVLFLQKSNKERVSIYKDFKNQYSTFSIDYLQKFPNHVFPFKVIEEHKYLIDKLLNFKKGSLDEILEVQQGIIYSGQKKEDVFSNERISSNYKKILDGRDIGRYKINWELKNENKFLNYTNKLHRPREERIFTQSEKIIFPRKSKSFVCAIDTEQYYLLNTAYIGILRPSEVNIYYIAALLNSRVINFYYQAVFFGWQITIPAINSLPIPLSIDKILLNKITNLVKNILNDKATNLDIKSLEDDLNNIIYEIYNLDSNDIDIIENYSYE